MFIYLSTKRFPSTTADHIYTRLLAGALARTLGGSFRLVIGGDAPAELEGIPTISVSAPSRLRSLFYFFWLPLFSARLERNSVFFSNDLYLLSALAFWKPLFSYRICSDWHLLSETWRDRYVARMSDALITTSARLREKLVEATGVSADRVHVTYGGIDPSPYTAPLSESRESLGLPEGKSLIGYVGFFKTMGQDKGLETMLRALAELPADTHMVFVGGTADEISAYRAMVEEAGVADRCTWVGRQSFEKVVAYERLLDVLVIPYPDTHHFRDYGFPMKVYEYLAAGKPIVYSQMAILDEVLAGRGEAFVPGDADSLAAAIAKAVTEEGRRTGERNGREIGKYSWEEKARAIATRATGA